MCDFVLSAGLPNIKKKMGERSRKLLRMALNKHSSPEYYGGEAVEEYEFSQRKSTYVL